MKRSVLLSLTGITSLTLLFLSAAHASPELRDMPHKGGANAQIEIYVEDFENHRYSDQEVSNATWKEGRITAPMSSMGFGSKHLIGGQLTKINVHGNLLYISRNDGFVIVDVSDPSSPTVIGNYLIQGNVLPGQAAHEIAVQGDYAFVAAGYDGLEIVDVSDPGHPSLVASFAAPHNGFTSSVAVSGDKVYLGGEGVGFISLDISTPSHPALISEYMVSHIKKMFVFGDVVVVASSKGLTALDVSDPYNPVAVSEVEGKETWAAGYYNHHILLAYHGVFAFVDATNPRNLRTVRSVGYYQSAYLCVDPSEGILYHPSLFGVIEASDLGDFYQLRHVDYASFRLRNPVDVGVGEDYVYPLYEGGYLGILAKVNVDDSVPTIAQSIPVDPGGAIVSRVKMTTQQFGAIDWSVSTDGSYWQPVQPNKGWTDLERPGTDLMWRAVLLNEGEGRSSCRRLEVRMAVGFSPERPGPTIVVQPDGGGDMPTIRDALLVAEPGDTILLAPGIYRGIGNRQLIVKERMDMTIRSMDGPEKTIIDGDGAEQWAHFGSYYYQSVSATEALPRVPSVPGQHRRPGDTSVSRPSRPTATSAPNYYSHDLRVVGITLQNFSGTALLASEYPGLVRNCFIRDCSVGLRSYEPGGFDVEKCLFEDNDMALDVYSLSMSDCMVRNNDTGIVAGGMTVSNTDIVENGLGVLGGVGNITMSGCRVIGNGHGERSPGKTFGGILLDETTIRMTDNLIMGNHGGGIVSYYRHGKGSATVFRNNIFVGNTAEMYGGALSGNFDLDIENNTFVANHAPKGSVIAFDGPPPRFKGNIIAFNTGGDPFASEDEEADPSRTVTLQDNDIFGNDGDPTAWTSDGGGNFSSDPWFCGVATNDYTLQSDSPCLPGNNPTGELVGAKGLGCDIVEATLALQPTTLSPRSNGIVTAVLSGAAGIEPATVRLNNFVEPLANDVRHGKGGTAFKFPAKDLFDRLAPAVPGESRTVTFTARLSDGRVARAFADVRIANAVSDPPEEVPIRAGDILVAAENGGGELILIRRDDGAQYRLIGPDPVRRITSIAFQQRDLITLGQTYLIRQTTFDTDPVILSSNTHLSRPGHIAANRNIIVAINDVSGKDIVAFDPRSGESSILFTSDVDMTPRDIVISDEGIIYVASKYTSKPGPILRIDAKIGAMESYCEALEDPRALALGPSGDLYAADWRGRSVYRITDKEAEKLRVSHMYGYPACIAVDDDGAIVLATSAATVYRVPPGDEAELLALLFDVSSINDIAIIPAGGFRGLLGKGEAVSLSNQQPNDASPKVTDGINTITPNPFNPVTRIRYGITTPGRVTLVVYDVAGRRVVTLVDTVMPAGTHHATWSADNTASGIYFARLTTPKGSWTRKLVVVK